MDETSGSSPANPQPIPPSKRPEPASQSTQIKPNRPRQILQTCDCGVPSPPAYAHGHGHACTGMRTAMVTRAPSHAVWRPPIHRGFPHTFLRLPHAATRLMHLPIRHGRSPIARPSPHTIYNHFKIGFSLDETSGSSPANPQPIPPSKRPEPASQSTQIKPNRPRQILQTCDWGVPSPPVCACTAMVMLARACVRPWSRAHLQGHARGHGHTFTCTATLSTRPAGPVHADLQSSLPTQKLWGAWATTTLRRRRRRGGGPAACM